MARQCFRANSKQFTQMLSRNVLLTYNSCSFTNARKSLTYCYVALH
jgi:hypothetical protein